MQPTLPTSSVSNAPVAKERPTKRRKAWPVGPTKPDPDVQGPTCDEETFDQATTQSQNLQDTSTPDDVQVPKCYRIHI